MALALEAPAKVNLILHVTGRRPDGYHELETVFHAVDLCDELVADVRDEPGVALTLESADGVGGLPVTADDDNLVVRAARAYLDASGAGGGLRFRLRKRIPAGGGLGGGSSNAAAALRLADRLHGDRLGVERLHAIASTLGADVPFFLRGGTQLGLGTGTELHPWPAVELHFVLLLPDFGTSTVAVYKNYRPQWHDDPPLNRIRSIEAQFSTGIRLASIFTNDLEPAAASAYPRLAGLRSRIVEAGFPQVRLSGSGSTMFLAFERGADASAAAARLASVADDESMAVITVGSADAKRVRTAPWSATRRAVNPWR